MNRTPIATNIIDTLALAGDKSLANKPWIVSETQTTTYGTLVKHVALLTRLFANAGLKPGNRVILSTANDHALSVLYMALLRNGLTAVIIDPETKLSRFKILAKITQPNAFIIDTEKKDDWQLGDTPFVLLVDKKNKTSKTLFSALLKRKKQTINKADNNLGYPSILNSLAPMEAPESISLNLDAYVLFTSGTTSKPKGVRITHGALAAHLETMSRHYEYDQNSRILNVLKLHHTDGITHGPVIALTNQCTVYRPFAFDIQHLGKLLDAIYTNRITHFIVAPTIIALISRLGGEYKNVFNTNEFKCLISSADVLDPRLWREFEERFNVNVANLYGLSETVVGGLFCGPDKDTKKIGTVGKPVDCSARIVDDKKRDVKNGQVGELLLKGDLIMAGYLSDPQGTLAVMEDGWFSTGDFFARDKEGFYIYKGRKKLLIITGGINVHPEEVTLTLLASKHTAEAVTFGEPEPTFGEKVISCVVLSEESTATTQDLIDHCRANLETEKIPSQIILLDSLPKTAAGKIDIEQVKKNVAAITGQSKYSENNSTEESIISIAATIFGVSKSQLSPHSSNTEIHGWDSLAHLNFITAIEQHFNVAFSTSEIMRVDCLNDAIQIVDDKQ